MSFVWSQNDHVLDYFLPRKALVCGTLSFGPRRAWDPLGSCWEPLGAIGNPPKALPMKVHRETYGKQAKNHA